MKKLPFVCLALVIVGVAVVAQSDPRIFVEDFEDQTAGGAPASSSYTYQQQSQSCTVQAAGGVGGGQALLGEFTGSAFRSCSFFVDGYDVCESGGMSMDIRGEVANNAQGGGPFYGIFNKSTPFSLSNLMFGLQFGSNVDTDTHLQARILTGTSSQTLSSLGGDVPVGTEWYAMAWTWDCETNEQCFDIPGLGIVEQCRSSAGGIAEVNARNSGDMAFSLTRSATSGTRDLWLDGWDTTPANLVQEEVAPADPAEFDAGLAALLISIGIVTPESQMFFVMGLVGVLLVGLAAALRWVSPGRLKNSILVGVACLVVVFGALFQYLETWMVVVPIVVGAFTAFGGAKVVQNTYFEVRKGLASLAGSVDLRPKARRGGKTLTSSASAGAPSASPAPESPAPAPESPAGEDA